MVVLFGLMFGPKVKKMMCVWSEFVFGSKVEEIEVVVVQKE